MESKINLTPSTSYDLSKDEFHRFYAAMSLLQYHYQRHPDYREQALVRRLRNDFERFNVEMCRACNREPNNLVLSQLRNFVQRHYGHLRQVVKETEGAN